MPTTAMPNPPSLRGHLRNSTGDIVVDIVLLLAIICSNIPQIARLKHSTSTAGLSPFSLVLNTFFTASQLSDMVFVAMAIWPNGEHPLLEEIAQGRLSGMNAFGGCLGLLQLFVQWSCSIALIGAFLSSSTSDQPRKTIFTLVLLDTIVVLLPTLVFNVPEPAHGMRPGIVMGFIGFANEDVAPTCAVIQFFPQLVEMWRRNGEPGALSLISLCLQVPVMAALAARWYLRVRTSAWNHRELAMRYLWAEPVINNTLCAIGCTLLLASYYFALIRTPSKDLEDERVALLA